MPQFFKGTEEKKPFTYPTITEVRKGSSNYTVWIIGFLVAIIIGVAIFVFR